MKNIAIVYRGLVRDPGDDRSKGYEVNDAAIGWCLENLNMLKECFKDHNVKTYSFSWTYPNSIKMAAEAKYDGHVLWNPPTQQELKSIIKSPYKDDNTLISTYGIFAGTKMILNLIENSAQKFDYICITRPDLRIKIDGEAWLKDCYQTTKTLLVNDMFAVAPSEDMYKIWNMSTEELNNLCETSLGHERIIQNRLERNSIRYEINENVQHYQLRNLTNLMPDDNIKYGHEFQAKLQQQTRG
jgi:hypothetical protein